MERKDLADGTVINMVTSTATIMDMPDIRRKSKRKDVVF